MTTVTAPIKRIRKANNNLNIKVSRFGELQGLDYYFGRNSDNTEIALVLEQGTDFKSLQNLEDSNIVALLEQDFHFLDLDGEIKPGYTAVFIHENYSVRDLALPAEEPLG